MAQISILLQAVLSLILMVNTPGVVPEEMRPQILHAINQAVEVTNAEILRIQSEEEAETEEDNDSEPLPDNEEEDTTDETPNVGGEEDEEVAPEVEREVTIDAPQSVALGQDIEFIVTVLEDGKDVQRAIFQVYVNGDRIMGDRVLATNTTEGQSGTIWYKDIRYTPESVGTYTIEVRSGDESESVEVTAE